MVNMVKPKNIMPIHGSLTFRYFNKLNFEKWGFRKDSIFLTDDGQMWEFNGRFWKRGKKIESKPILIDGLGVGDIGDIVLKDRKQLSEFGMFVVILNISANSKKIMGKPRFLSRGFIYFKNSQSLLKEIQMCIFDSHRNWLSSNKDIKKLDNKELKTQLEKDLGKLIYKKTEREPIVLVDVM